MAISSSIGDLVIWFLAMYPDKISISREGEKSSWEPIGSFCHTILTPVLLSSPFGGILLSNAKINSGDLQLDLLFAYYQLILFFPSKSHFFCLLNLCSVAHCLCFKALYNLVLFYLCPVFVSTFIHSLIHLLIQ